MGALFRQYSGGGERLTLAGKAIYVHNSRPEASAPKLALQHAYVTPRQRQSKLSQGGLQPTFSLGLLPHCWRTYTGGPAIQA